MHIDLSTIYDLIIGTLLVAVAMTLWERQANPQRGRVLGTWAGAYMALAAGCLVAVNRGSLPGIWGAALANILITAGYLLVMQGARSLDQTPRHRWSALLLTVLALLWSTAGAQFPTAFWTYAASLPIALICGWTALLLGRSRSATGLRTRPIAAAISGGHALFYLLRACAMPFVAARWGSGCVMVAAKVTMYEGALYAVGMPMALLALVREDAHRTLLELSRTDYLTGLGNRQAFFERGTPLMAARAPGQPLTLLAFDLDHFKSINDRHGHAAGDAVLTLFAAVLREAVAEPGVPVRLGGEEFAALLPGHDVAAAGAVATAVARAFKAQVMRRDAIPATVSIGLAQAVAPDLTLDRLLSAADQALYRAKARGRDRLELAEPPRAVDAA